MFYLVLHPIRKVLFITDRKRSLGQGNIFAPVGHSVHREGSASVHAGIPPYPPQSRPTGGHPQEQAPPRNRQTPHLPAAVHAGR